MTRNASAASNVDDTLYSAVVKSPPPAAQISRRQADLDRWLHDTSPSKTRQEATATGVPHLRRHSMSPIYQIPPLY